MALFNTILDRALSCFLFSIILLYEATPACSQEKYIIHHYTNENGLPANGIKGIELDSTTGFLWVGTQAGLVRFDGTYFKQFGSPKNTAAAFRISFIARNSEGTIYCEDENFSVYRIEHNKPEFVMTDTFLIDPSIIRGGGYHIRTAAQMARILQNHKRSSFLPHWIVFGDEARDNRSFSFIYYGDAGHYSSEEDSLVMFPGFDNVLKLQGHIYFARSGPKLWEYKKELKKLVSVPIEGMPGWNDMNGEMPRLIWTPGMDEPLLIYKTDIWMLQRAENTVRALPVCKECCPPDADISSAQVWKKQGIIFLGSEVNGLYVVKKPFLRTIRADTTIDAGRSEYAQVEIMPGTVNTSSGLSFSSTGEVNLREASLKFPHSNIYQSQNGDCWFFAGDTIVHFYRNKDQYVKIAVNDGASRMVFRETGGRIYVISDLAIGDITGDQYQLLYRLPYSTTELRNSLNPTEAIEWKPGLLAIATEKLVLFDTEKNKKLDTISIRGLTAKVRGLLKITVGTGAGTADYMLIGTYGQGFYMYKNGIVKKMPLDKHGYLSFSHCFILDEKGFCWISTNNGLFKVSLNALVKAYENDLTEVYYHYFGKDDGIYNTELNGGCQPCALKLSSGLYSIPSINGIVVFDPMEQHSPPPAGLISVDEILADSISYQPGQSSLQTLPYYLRNLRFRLAVPQFGDRQNIYFSYKLEPYNNEWETQDIIQNNTILFGGLNPGRYKLYLRVRNGFEPDQFGMTVMEFRILKPWFQTWWFYLLCFLGLVALTLGLIKWRTVRLTRRKKELQRMVAEQTRNMAVQSKQLEGQLHQLKSQQSRLEEDNKIKARLIAIISHDMLSPLKFMSFMSRKLRDAFSPSDPAYKTADSMTTVTHELESLSVNILNWIRFHYETDKMKPERFNLYELINESIEIPFTLAKEKGIRVQNDIGQMNEISQYRQALGVIIYNLAMNAVKYTETGEIRISGHHSDDYFTLMISDTGKGMSGELVDLLNSDETFLFDSPGEIKKFQFGYRIIKDLLQLINGKMQIESRLNGGTIITVRVKVMQ